MNRVSKQVFELNLAGKPAYDVDPIHSGLNKSTTVDSKGRISKVHSCISLFSGAHCRPYKKVDFPRYSYFYIERKQSGLLMGTV